MVKRSGCWRVARNLCRRLRWSWGSNQLYKRQAALSRGADGGVSRTGGAGRRIRNPK
jgi:hypothetical protein